MTHAERKEYLEWLVAECGYVMATEINADRWVAVTRLMFHGSLITGIMGDKVSVEDRYCYPSTDAAIGALLAWGIRGFAGEPDGWNRHVNTGRRRPDGDATQEYIQP